MNSNGPHQIHTYQPNFYTNFAYINLNGLKRQHEELKHFIHEQQLDIILLNETHLRPCDKVKIPNYTLYRKDRLTNRGGGVAIYIKRSIKSTEYLLPQLNSIEACAVIIDNKNFGELLVISVYNPPNSKIVKEDLEFLFNTGLPTIVAGDLNSKSTTWGCRADNANGHTLRKFILKSGVTLIAPDEPTHFPTTLSHRPDILDIMLLKGIPSYPTPKVHSCLSSDHSPVTFTLYGLTQSPEKDNFITNWEKFNTLSRENISADPPLLTTDQIDAEIDKLTYKIKRDIDNSSRPIKTNPEYKLPSYIREEIKDKNRLRKVYKITRHPQSKRKWNEACRKVSKLVSEHRQTTWEDTIVKLTTSNNSVWRMAKALKSTPQNIGPLQDQNKIVYTEYDMARVLATSLQKQFTPHHTPINHDLVDEVSSEVSHYLNIQPTLNIKHTSPDEVQNIIIKLDPKKASGYDFISNKALKNLSLITIVLITNIFNACIRHNYFPTSWKRAIIILFKKPGKSPLQPSSYRPISLLPTLAKVFERVILIRLLDFTETNHIINMNQYGFKKGHSTTHQVHRIIELIGNAFNNKEHVGAVFLDIEKAFDSLWHEGLIKKLINLNIPKAMIHIIYSFLTNRCFQVRINNTLSQVTNIQAGVPQGSTLSPSLFNLYINDFPTLPNCITAQFADDTAILAKSKQGNIAFEHIQNALYKVETWCEDWRIKINAQKSVSVLFRNHHSNRHYDTDLEIFNTNIQNQPHTKYLGVHLDRRLNFKEHIRQNHFKSHGC